MEAVTLEQIVGYGVDGLAVGAVVVLWRTLRADAEIRRQEDGEFRDRLIALHSATIEAMKDHTTAVRDLTQMIEVREKR